MKQPPSQMTTTISRDLTDKEIADRKDLALQKVFEHQEVKAAKAAATSRFNATLKELESDFLRLGREARQKTAEFEVPVREDRDDVRSMVRLLHRDTGEEVKPWRGMTLEERGEAFVRKQPTLFDGLPDPEAEASGAGDGDGDGAGDDEQESDGDGDEDDADASPDGPVQSASGDEPPPVATPDETIEHNGQRLRRAKRRPDGTEPRDETS